MTGAWLYASLHLLKIGRYVALDFLRAATDRRRGANELCVK